MTSSSGHGLTPKGQLYSTSLDHARRSNLFTTSHPADSHGKVLLSGGSGHHTTGADGMDWKELARKFVKHSGRELTATTALAEQQLHSLLPPYTPSRALSTSPPPQTPSSTSSPRLPPPFPLLPLTSSKSQQAREALSTLDQAISSGTKGSLVERESAKVVLAWGYWLVSEVGKSEEVLRGFSTEVERGEKGAQLEGYDWVLRVLKGLLEGVIAEFHSNSPLAITAYEKAARTYVEAVESFGRNATADQDVLLHRYGEAALYRVALWSKISRGTGTMGSLAAHQLYLSHALRFHSSTTANQMHIHRSYRSLLLLLHPSSSTSSTSPSSPITSTTNPTTLTLTEWHTEMARNNAAQEQLVRRTTTLPRAGEVNGVYSKFLDEVAEGWRVGGSSREGAPEVVEIMYSALTHTFQSQRLLRHLIRALVAKGSYAEAGKALKLYVELWDKARETDAEQVAKDVKKFRERRERNATPRGRAGEGEKVMPSLLEQEQVNGDIEQEKEEAGEVEVEVDIDSDVEFIKTAVFGSRVFCKYLNDPRGGVKLAKRAREIFDEGKETGLREDKAVESRIERALGVGLGSLVAKDSDPETRDALHAEALTHLQNAVNLDPTSWENLYHLSYHLAETRQIPQALENARRAVELNSSSRDCWHLLGLLVASQKDFGGALQVLETALDGGDEGDSEEGGVSGTSGVQTPGGLKTTVPANEGEVAFITDEILSQPNGTASSSTPSTSLDVNGLDTALAAALPSPSSSGLNPEEFPRDDTEILASEVQIRITKNVIVEVLEGPQAALLDQQSLFAFFRQTFLQVRGGEEHPPSTGHTESTPSESSAPSAPTDSPRRSLSLLSRKRSVKTANGTINGNVDGGSLPPMPALGLVLPSSTAPYASLSNLSVDDSRAATATATSSTSLESNPRALKLLTDIWLLSAASYRRAGKLEDARGAIQEAELLNADDPDVWLQFALYNLALSRSDVARTCLMKALAFSPTHVSSLVHLARLYLSTSQHALAEGLLQVTKYEAWDVPEAWFELSRCYKGTNRPDKERSSLVWALQLEESRSARSWACLPRLL